MRTSDRPAPLGRRKPGFPASSLGLLARDLHDGVGQNLAYLHLELSSLASQDSVDGKELRERLQRLVRAAREGNEQLRMALGRLHARERHPCSLQETALECVNSLRAKTGLLVEVEFCKGTGPILVSGETGYQVGAVIREALWNSWLHSQASRRRLAIQRKGAGVSVAVTDDGRGFDASSRRPGHYGLSIMRERAKAIGARLQVSAAPGQGTCVALYLPQQLLRAGSNPKIGSEVVNGE